MTVLDTLKSFLADEDAWNMYVTGPAGSGKTTDLRYSLEYCIENDIPHVVCAFTHKACGILRTKLPPKAVVMTMHSFLKKCPTINQDATNVNHVNSNLQVGTVKDRPKIVFVDEYSMVGEKDWEDLGLLQDPNYEGKPEMKVVWVGDNNQLPPVGDQIAVRPEGKYQVKLTKIYRNDNPLQQPLNALISYIAGKQPKPLQPQPNYFERNIDIVKGYCNSEGDSVVLAYTNKNVQALNERIHKLLTGRDEVQAGDEVFSPSTQKFYTFNRWVEPDEITYIDMNWTDPLHLDSKYKTLEHLINEDLCRFAELTTEEGDVVVHAVIFGHYDFKQSRELLEVEAVEANRNIEEANPGFKASSWSKAHPKNKLSRKRAKAWRSCLSFKDCVLCIDFAHAMTVHKSQGSTYDNVFIDMNDIFKVADKDIKMYFKLVYVGISRARFYVGTN